MGLGIEKPMTLTEVATIYKVSRRRIEQLRDKSIERLKRSGKIRKLNPYK